MSMQRQALVVSILAAAAAIGCGVETPEAEKPDPALLALEAKALPEETARRTFLDFGGKLALLGYELGTSGPVSAGGEIPLTLYWQASAPLDPGWQLGAEVLSQGSPLSTEVRGALHGGDSKFGPSGFRVGRLYKDELTIKLPDALPHAEVTITASVMQSLAEPEAERRAPVFRLPVLSGPSAGNNRGVVAHLPATVTQKAAAPAANERQRRSRRRDSAPAPSAR
jgi:hypothetical protein